MGKTFRRNAEEDLQHEIEDYIQRQRNREIKIKNR